MIWFICGWLLCAAVSYDLVYYVCHSVFGNMYTFERVIYGLGSILLGPFALFGSLIMFCNHCWTERNKW